MSTTPFEELGLSPEATEAEVRAKWRELASQHHPDKGGNAENFRRYHTAYEEAMSLAGQPKLCDSCGGSGKVSTSRGFYQLTMVCAICRGSGIR